MPVLSPRRSSSSTLNGSYRNTFSTSNLDRPYYGSNGYSPRINSYSERYTTRSYIDGDGRRIFARQGSITEDGVTTRFKEELCEPNSLRDSLSWGDSVRESSVYDGLPSRYDRESSLTRSISRDTTTTSSSRAPLTPINVAESVAELHKKYSPANYVPACRRKSEIISRSKSINDIGKPPLLVEQSIENKKSSLERHHRAGAGGREHLDSYGRQSAAPLPHLGGVGSVVSTRNTGLNGLKNIGNTCFMNSVLQCLSNTRPLLEYVKNDSYLKDINTTISGMKGALIKAFAQVIKELWSEDSSDRVVNTVSLKSQIQRFAPRFMGYAQQDAQEFLRYLLEGLHEDVNCVTVKPKPIHTEIDEKLSDSEKSAESWRRYLRMDNSKIVDIFVGQLKSTLRCTHCGHCSVTFDPFWDLSLPIPQRAGPLRLQQCLECFTREETLDGDEKPTCSKCKERRKCTKSFSIQKFPKILVIHLKRFSPTERYRGKLSLTIDFPIEGLDMQNYAADGSNGDCRYNLYAISNHSGTTYSGHYTAYCRHPYTQSWHEYNDSRVSPISSKSLVSGEAYVLFYELENQKSHL